MSISQNPASKDESPAPARRLVVDMFVTMDGVLQAPGAPEEDPTDDFRYGGWSAAYWDEAMDRVLGESLSKPHELLLGRKTYDVFAAYWPTRDDDRAALLNKVTKYVASRTRNKLDWENSSLLSGDVADAVRKLKAKSGPPIHVLGSGNLVQTLLRNDLVDELEIWVFPVVVGRGKRLFQEGAIPTAWKLTRSETFGTGVRMEHYERAGEIALGRPPGT